VEENFILKEGRRGGEEYVGEEKVGGLRNPSLSIGLLNLNILSPHKVTSPCRSRNPCKTPVN